MKTCISVFLYGVSSCHSITNKNAIPLPSNRMKNIRVFPFADIFLTAEELQKCDELWIILFCEFSGELFRSFVALKSCSRRSRTI